MVTQKVTIKDIARMAGVSEGTVDRVLHNRGKVSSDSLAKVNKVLSHIDYKADLIARHLSKNKKKNIKVAVITPFCATDPYWGQAAEGIRMAETEWEPFGIKISHFQYSFKDRAYSFAKIASEALSQSPDGLVIAPNVYLEAVSIFSQLAQNPMPFVFFNTNLPEFKPLSFIGQDLWQSGRLAAQLMVLGSGQRGGKLLVLHIGESITDSTYLLEKENGFRNYFNTHGGSAFEVISANLDPDSPLFIEDIQRYIADTSVKGIFVPTSNGTTMVASAIASIKRSGLTLVGYDALDGNLQYMREGVLDFLIIQNPKRQALVGINHLVNYLLFGREAPSVDLFALEVVTSENAESYVLSRFH